MGHWCGGQDTLRPIYLGFFFTNRIMASAFTNSTTVSRSLTVSISKVFVLHRSLPFMLKVVFDGCPEMSHGGGSRWTDGESRVKGAIYTTQWAPSAPFLSLFPFLSQHTSLSIVSILGFPVAFDFSLEGVYGHLYRYVCVHAHTHPNKHYSSLLDVGQVLSS